MELQHLFSPDQTQIATATAAGSFVALLVTQRPGWLHVFTLFVVGQITALYWTEPMVAWFGWTMAAYRPFGFIFGAVGMLIWGGILSLVQQLHDDPLGTITWAWGLWRGNNGRRDHNAD